MIILQSLLISAVLCGSGFWLISHATRAENDEPIEEWDRF